MPLPSSAFHLMDGGVQETASALVWALAFDKECREAISAAYGIPSLINLCAASGSSTVQEHAAGGRHWQQPAICKSSEQAVSMAALASKIRKCLDGVMQLPPSYAWQAVIQMT